jgi:hypothetical protein
VVVKGDREDKADKVDLGVRANKVGLAVRANKVGLAVRAVRADKVDLEADREALESKVDHRLRTKIPFVLIELLRLTESYHSLCDHLHCL